MRLRKAVKLSPCGRKLSGKACKWIQSAWIRHSRLGSCYGQLPPPDNIRFAVDFANACQPTPIDRSLLYTAALFAMDIHPYGKHDWMQFPVDLLLCHTFTYFEGTDKEHLKLLSAYSLLFMYLKETQAIDELTRAKFEVGLEVDYTVELPVEEESDNDFIQVEKQDPWLDTLHESPVTSVLRISIGVVARFRTPPHDNLTQEKVRAALTFPIASDLPKLLQQGIA